MSTPSSFTFGQVLGLVISVLTLVGMLGAVFMRVGSMQTELERNREEITRLRNDVQGLENYIRDAFR